MGNRQKLKQAAVAAIQADIHNLDANALEYIGHSLVQLLEGGQLIHRGLNADGKPVGYSLDTFSANREVIGEYSTEQGYFDSPFGKFRGDCQHAKQQAPKCLKLYLISNRECANSDWQKIGRVAKEELGAGIAFEIYDSRRLADDLYEQVISKNNLVEYFSDFLPSLWKIWTENLISNSPPGLTRDFVHDKERAEKVSQAVQQHSRVAIRGISGTGKTYAAIEYTKGSGHEYRNTFWLSGDELAGVTNSAAIRIDRLGVEVNLASHLQTAPCLLIIDDWKEDPARLAALLPSNIHPGTRILITCIQDAGRDFLEIELPPLSAAAAAAILEQNLSVRPSDDQRNAVLARVGSHPLTLAVIRDTVREAEVPWPEIVADLDNVPQYEGADQKTLLQRILLNHSAGIANELCVLRWLDVAAIDGTVALALLHPAGLAKVLRRSILRKDAHGMCRLHDLMRACIRHFEGNTPGDEEIAVRLQGYFENRWEQGSFHFQRALQIHRSFIANRVEQSAPTPSLEAYLLLLAESVPVTPAFVDKLSGCPIREVANNRPSCLSVIEAIERTYHLSRRDEKGEILRRGIENISAGLEVVAEARIRADLLHHRGKLLLWRNDDGPALSDFEQTLKENPSAYHAHLQIARIKARREDESSVGHIDAIISTFEDDNEGVSITLVLAAFSELEKKTNRAIRGKWLSENLAVLVLAISLATAEGFSQPYRTLGRISRYFYYEHPKVLIHLADTVSFPPAVNANVRECFEIAECLKSVGKACSEEIQDAFAQQSWLNRALEYYDRVEKPKEFHLTMRAECLIRLERFDEALTILDLCAAQTKQAHWWHRRSQALLGMNQTKEALAAIENALSVNPDERYESAFLHVKAKVEAAQGARACIDTLRDAISKATSSKFRGAMEADLSEFDRRFA